ncbi:MAG: sulfatase-like hydrolase/transferase [Verrucomicrobiales bacterium]|nr:sulfatase-like hydrolase/transferase [Verrucomicrobiales bacterium]
MRISHRVATLILASFLALITGHSEDAPRPNILYFYVDDMGWGSIGPNGQSNRRSTGLPNVKTPTIDQLAAEGINFTRAYGCTVCSPARSSQQTGFHQGHTFADRNDPNNAKKAIRAEDVTMGDLLSKAGYTTGYWGKWGYGGSKDLPNPVIENLQTLPTSHGYQYVLAELHHVRAHTFFQPTLWAAPAPSGSKGGLHLVPNSLKELKGNANYPDSPSNHNSPNYPDRAYCDDTYALAALDFVKANAAEYRKHGTPFFGLFAAQIPHAPFKEVSTLPGWDAAYRGDPHFSNLGAQTQQWAAMVTRIDAHFGNILAALDDPNGDGDTSDSVSNETLVIFMSDNGGPSGRNNAEMDANGGLRANKGSIYEGGIRVPTVMRWPGKIRANQVNEKPIDVTDLLPTFCDLAGIDSPVGIDGVSLAPLLTGKEKRREREFLIHEAGKSQSIIKGDYKLVRSPKGLELYNLKTDLAESENLAAGEEELVDELETLLLGERVDEPRGFANTYHHWTGADDATTSDPDNWSDYRYENAGVVYTEITGAPDVSWVATMENTEKQPRKANADSDLKFLGLEIKGNSEMKLELGSDINLTGRNEIRLSENGVLSVNGGTVTSLRWIDVREGAGLRGNGSVEATIYNSGDVSISASDRPGKATLQVVGNYIESAGANLSVSDRSALRIHGTAELAGILRLNESAPINWQTGDSFEILTANSITGKFANHGNQVVTRSGARLRIRYTENSVFLEIVALPRKVRS